MTTLLHPMQFANSENPRERENALYSALYMTLTQRTPKLMTVREFAAAKGVTRSTVYRWEKEGLIEFETTSPVRIDREQLTRV